MGFDPGHVGVGKTGDAIRRQLLDDGADGGAKTCLGLQRQSVDQIDVDRGKTEAARLLDVLPGELERLNPLDRRLHRRIDVLETHREAVETEPAKGREMLHGGDARIDLKRHLGVRCQPEPRGDGCEEPLALSGGQVRRGAAPPVKLVEIGTRAECGRQDFEFLFDRVEVGLFGTAPRRNHHAATAEGAPRLAERKVDVHRERFVGTSRRVAQPLPVGRLVEIRAEVRRRRIRGVARTGPIVLRQKLGRESGGVEGHGADQVVAGIFRISDFGFRISNHRSAGPRKG